MRKSFDSRRPWGRLFYLLIAVLVAMPASRLEAQAPLTTQVTDIVYRSNGTPAQGTVLISWGSSQLARDANNFFGIKSHGGRPFIELPTTEVLNGAAQGVFARFACYASMAECFADRDAILGRVPRYAAARAAAGDPEAFTRALALHWATDPAYAEKILMVYRAEGLAVLDRRP